MNRTTRALGVVAALGVLGLTWLNPSIFHASQAVSILWLDQF